MALSFNGREFTFTQPDGSRIPVRGWGNQYYAVFETLDGFTIIQNQSTQFFEYAKLSDDGDTLESTGIPVGSTIPPEISLSRKLRVNPGSAKKQAIEAKKAMPKRQCEIRREQAKAASLQSPVAGVEPAPPTQTTIGSFVGLCLLIEFPDDGGIIPQAEVERFCNQPGYSGFQNNGSVFDYFRDNSNGEFDYTNIVTPYYMAQKNRSYYTDERIPFPQRARELISEAIAHFDSQGFDFSPLTTDDNDNIIALNIFYAGNRTNNWSKGLWPHSSSLLAPLTTNSGNKALDYQFTNIGDRLLLGTFCHENGHMICGFPDLYDTGFQSSGLGAYCLMSSEGDPKNPVQISAYLKYKAGWANSVKKITPGSNIAISAGINDFYIYQNPNDPAEYFIIENRRASGRDASIPSQGLAIWHIDESGNNQNEQMTLNQHYECSLEQSDNNFDLERRPYSYGDAQDLFSATTNRRFGNATFPDSKWWDGTPSGLEIIDISLPGATITLRVPGNTGTSQLTALANTKIKKSTNPSQGLPQNGKFDLAAGQTLTLTSFHSTINNHWELELDLASSPDGTSKWFAFKPHVDIQ